MKGHDQQQLQQLYGLRETWKKSCTQRVNLLRGLLREVGIEAPASTIAFIRVVSERVNQPEPASLSRLLHITLAETNPYEQCMAECEQQLKRWHAGGDIVRKLDGVSGTGLLIASVLTTVVDGPERFASGRQLSV